MNIAFFDFDGTITTKDTFIQFIRFSVGSFKFYWGFLIHIPVIIAYKIGIVANWKAKELLFSYFFKGMAEEDLLNKGKEFSRLVVPKLLRPEALKEIVFHKKSNTKIVVVTASFSLWVKPWCEQGGIELIATEHEVKNSKLTGKMKGKNCHGKEKPARIKAQYNLNEYEQIYAYGDSPDDLYMLSLADLKWMKWKPTK
jgi:HAD superfamily hydrolase (TIGR01490 family)